MYSYISLVLAAERAKDLQSDAAVPGTAGKPGRPGGPPAAAGHRADRARQPGAGQLRGLPVPDGEVGDARADRRRAFHGQAVR